MTKAQEYELRGDANVVNVEVGDHGEIEADIAFEGCVGAEDINGIKPDNEAHEPCNGVKP